MERIPVSPAASLEWTAVAQGARFSNHMLANVGEPAQDSNFAKVHELYPFESVSAFAKRYLDAALEHLLLWADYAAPLKFHPEHQVTFTLRPAYTLARAALESAAPAVWLLNAVGPRECLRRYLCLVRWDLDMHARSTPDPVQQSALRKQDADLLALIQGEFSDQDVRRPRGYEAIIKLACEDPEVRLDAVEASWIWKAASGSAHGMPWAATDLQEWITVDRGLAEPSPILVPDVARMAQALQAAQSLTSYGCVKFALFAGADVAALMEDARVWLANVITFKPDGDPEVQARLRAAQTVAE